MGECIGLDDNWGLQAIVQPPLMTSDFNPQSCHLFDVSQGDVLTLDDFVETTMVSKDVLLEELYKPFYQPSSISFSGEVKQQASSAVRQIRLQDDDGEVKQEAAVHQILLQDDDDLKKGSLDESSSVLETPNYVPKFKKRKNEHKRVVIQVPAEGLSEDKWAWRKYGQKPIKGSPYPRSYYRCSSSKGCLARKQVEQSNTAPGIFIVTYTAEHSHSQPTRRNSLAGTIRNKFPPSTSKTIPPKIVKTQDSTAHVPELASALSPAINNSRACSDEETKIKDEDEELAEKIVEISDQSGMQLMDNEDFFAGLEDLDGLISQFSYSSQYYPSMFSS